MPYVARAKTGTPPVTGTGALRLPGFAGAVDFSLEGEPSKLRSSAVRLRGWIETEPTIATAAFRAGEAELKLDGGEALRLTFLGHTVADRRVYFEARG